jgi:hypothetical protein
MAEPATTGTIRRLSVTARPTRLGWIDDRERMSPLRASPVSHEARVFVTHALLAFPAVVVSDATAARNLRLASGYHRFRFCNACHGQVEEPSDDRTVNALPHFVTKRTDAE